MMNLDRRIAEITTEIVRQLILVQQNPLPEMQNLKSLVDGYVGELMIYQMFPDKVGGIEPVTREWYFSTGCWVYSCGCHQYQDAWEYCQIHKRTGYAGVLAALVAPTEGPK
jgi:hypothetical protein